MAIDSGRVNWMQRVFPVRANQQKSQPLFETDYQSFLEVFRRATGALPDAAFRAFVGPRSGNKGHYVLPKTGILGNNDESQAVRKARASQRHMEAPFARNPSVLPHVRARRRGLYFGGKDMPCATEAGRIISNFTPAHDCSSVELVIGRFLGRPMIGGVLSEIDFGNTAFLG